MRWTSWRSRLSPSAPAETWDEDALYDLVRSAFPYRDNAPETISMRWSRLLSEGIATKRGRSGALLHRDQVNHRIRGRRGRARGHHLRRRNPRLGELCRHRRTGRKNRRHHRRGFRRRESHRRRLPVGHPLLAHPPCGTGQGPLGRCARRATLAAVLAGQAPGRQRNFTRQSHKCEDPPTSSPQNATDEAGAKQAHRYLKDGAASLGAMPSTHTVIAERFFDESGGMQLVLQRAFGSAHQPRWGLARAKRFCRTFKFRTASGSYRQRHRHFAERENAFPLETVFDSCIPTRWKTCCARPLLVAPMFTARWRWNASRLSRSRVFAATQGARAHSAHARGRPARVRSSRTRWLPLKISPASASRTIRWSMKPLPIACTKPWTVDGLRHCAGRSAGWKHCRIAFDGPNPFRCFRTRSSTPIRTLIWTTPRSKSAVHGPCIAKHAAHRCCPKARAFWTRKLSNRLLRSLAGAARCR